MIPFVFIKKASILFMVLLIGACCSGPSISIKPTDNLEEGQVKRINAVITATCGINSVQASFKKSSDSQYQVLSGLPIKSGDPATGALYSYDIPESGSFSGGEIYDFRWDIQYDSKCRAETVFSGSKCVATPMTESSSAADQFTVPACVPDSYSDLSVSLIGQRTINWCWAASGQMIMQYLGATADVSQCTQANDKFERTDCCEHGGGVCGLNPFEDTIYAVYYRACIEGGWPDWNRYGFDASWINRALTWDELKKQLSTAAHCKGSPVAFSWNWENDGSHIMVARGYSDNGSDRQVFINEPGLPPCFGDTQWISYDEYMEEPGDHTHGRDYYNIRRRTP